MTGTHRTGSGRWPLHIIDWSFTSRKVAHLINLSPKRGRRPLNNRAPTAEKNGGESMFGTGLPQYRFYLLPDGLIDSPIDILGRKKSCNYNSIFVSPF